jgi:hypothetical protein
VGLLEDAKGIFKDALGPDVAKQLDDFEDPEKYPDIFLKECVFFLGKLVGEASAEEKLRPLVKKYSDSKGAKKGIKKKMLTKSQHVTSLLPFPSPGILNFSKNMTPRFLRRLKHEEIALCD